MEKQLIGPGGSRVFHSCLAAQGSNLDGSGFKNLLFAGGLQVDPGIMLDLDPSLH